MCEDGSRYSPVAQASILPRASAMDRNQCAFRHSSRRRPLNDSANALSVGPSSSSGEPCGSRPILCCAAGCRFGNSHSASALLPDHGCASPAVSDPACGRCSAPTTARHPAPSNRAVRSRHGTPVVESCRGRQDPEPVTHIAPAASQTRRSFSWDCQSCACSNEQNCCRC
jgi:hypothetical protein